MRKYNYSSPHPWTDEQIRTLKAEYSTVPMWELVERLGHPEGSIRTKAGKLGLHRSRHGAPQLDIGEVRERIEYLMKKLDTRGYMPRQEELNTIGLNSYKLIPFGGIRKLSAMLGIPMLPARIRREDLPSSTDIYEMSQVRPSKAFEYQMCTGKLWKDKQMKETIERYARVDISAFAGFKPYAERMGKHG